MKDDQQEAITDAFHFVRSLLGENRNVKTTTPDTTVGEALAAMQKNGYSQLPIVVGDRVLGVFSYRSLAYRLNQMDRIDVPIGDLPVGEFIEHWPHVLLDDKWESIIDELDRYDGVLAGPKNDLAGIITTMDVLQYLHRLAAHFVMIAEIEVSLRKIIAFCVSGDTLASCIRRSLRAKYGSDETPTNLDELSFSDYAMLISNGQNWKHFERIFGKGELQRKLTVQRLKEVRKIRNEAFHFRRKFTEEDHAILTDHRDWLKMKVMPFASSENAGTKPSSKSENRNSRSKTTLVAFYEKCTNVADKFFGHVFQTSQRRGHSVNPGKIGFVIKAYLSQSEHPIGFIYVFPADRFIFRFRNLPFSEEEINSIRTALLKTGIFEREGDRGVKASVRRENHEQLKDQLEWIFLKVDSLISKYRLTSSQNS